MAVEVAVIFVHIEGTVSVLFSGLCSSVLCV